MAAAAKSAGVTLITTSVAPFFLLPPRPLYILTSRMQLALTHTHTRTHTHTHTHTHTPYRTQTRARKQTHKPKTGGTLNADDSDRVGLIPPAAM